MFDPNLKKTTFTVMIVMKVMIDSVQKVIISNKNYCFLFPQENCFEIYEASLRHFGKIPKVC
jgi:hypothetical protein